MNTPFIIGVVVYTGRDTKLVLNQQPVPLKFSYVERTTNKLLIALVAFILTLCLITAVLSVYWRVRAYTALISVPCAVCRVSCALCVLCS